MAGLCGNKILLLGSLLITLASSTSPTNTSTEAPPASTSPSSQSADSVPQTKGAQNQTSPQSTQYNTTAITTATSSASAQCFYTVTPINFGFRIEIKSAGNYSISVAENGQAEIETSITDFFNQSSTHNFTHLKPCTDYELNVTLTDNGTTCENTGNETKTTGLSEEDIKSDTCIPGYVCYQRGWDLSFSVSPPNTFQRCPDDTLCIKPGYNDICSSLTTTFTAENCNKSFSFTEDISVDFLNPSEIHPHVHPGLPTNITSELPPNCKNLTIDYTCSENGNDSKSLSDLEPFTDYTCTGLIKDNNKTIDKTTTVPVRINCRFTITNMNKAVTNTSAKLSWKTTSENCQEVLPKLQKLSYDCRCYSKTSSKQITVKQTFNGGTCEITGLKPYTDYTCKVQPTYNNIPVDHHRDVPLKTEPGIPANITKVTVTVPEHNVIHVSCEHSRDGFHGPEQKYIIRLNGDKKKLDKCEHEFRDLSYSTTYTVKVTAFNGKLESKPVVKEVSTLYNDKAVIGFLVFLIILTSIALLLVVYKIWILKRRKSNDLSENMMLISTGIDEENLMPVEPIAAEVLLEAYKRKLADEGRLFLAEFQSVPRIFSRYTVREAKKACNAQKNRYVDILPYDYNRVQLTTGNGEAGCDYINASFIDGFKEPKKYIAAQGPKDETVSDFWRMVWEQQSSIIVMVTRCEEGNRIKCAQYWPSPERETEIFEEFIVKLTSEDHCPDYTIRHLSLINKREKNSEREVTHIQFMSWPDHGVPGDPHLLLKLRRRVNAFKNFFSGPIVVHCSAGVGRTGTYIGIDAMMEGLEAEGRVDIYGYVVRLRRQRCLMVQVEAQYILIHQALLEHNQFGETEIPLSELHSTLSTLNQKNADNEPTLMEEEFERLPTFKNWRTFNTGITEENKKNNRSSSVIPYDYNRVLVKVDEGSSRDTEPDEDEEEDSSDEEDEDCTKYINASHIGGYWGQRAFIAAQTPLPDTMADFWMMVYQKKASNIAMLSECNEGDQDSDCVYWDKDKKTFGDIEVEVTGTDTSPTFISRNMLIRHVKRKENRPVKQFQFLKWGNKDLPEKPQDLTDMIKDIRHNCGSRSQRGMPIVVHCNDGSTRSGIFCALWNLLDSAETEKLVDVFQVAKTLRKERQNMLSDLEHYQFLYDALQGVFPVQNGEVKPVQATAADSVQIVNETKAAEQPTEEKKAEEPASTTSSEQQVAAENTPLMADGGKEDKKGEPEKEASAPTETAPLEETSSNGPTVTVEV
ncbi:receptor-type tyrosine-protein phosphatase C isoform X2 [Parambassis ranga]|uniref:Receptor-type tyrosine-protein phosphatase C n=1 Tax=Parambassis ranga TaxID=210632 RepID=A0A6P7HZJ6_9TELE|nr:receptor-type tyrosine-protein phosphatase C isoform X2 [Parambassis ranga]